MSSSVSAGKESCIEIDRISNLPDCVLCHILSFLQTKLSIRTCVLSKRWKSLWKDVPCLHFRHSPHDRDKEIIKKKDADFEKLVTMSLSMNRCQSLDTFHLDCLNDAENFNLFPSWLSSVITYNVRIIDLHFMSSDTFSVAVNLPNRIFTAKSLEILRLQGDLLVGTPDLVSLPRLECLRLDGVKYESAESVRKLIGGCPVLKSLYIERNSDDNVGTFTVSSDTLERLEILARPFDTEDTLIVMKLEIKAPSLKYFNLCDYGSESISLETLPNLEELHVGDYYDVQDLLFFDEPDDLPKVREWIRDLADNAVSEKLKILSIGDEEVLNAFAGSRKVFPSLTNLIITCSSWNWTTLLQLLEKTENLKVLTLREHGWEFDENYGAPRCLLSSLEKISMVSWLPNPYDVKDKVAVLEYDMDPDLVVGMVKYFLKHGEFLQQINLTNTYLDLCQVKHSYFYGERRIRNFRDVLLGLSRKSSDCEIRVIAKLLTKYQSRN